MVNECIDMCVCGCAFAPTVAAVGMSNEHTHQNNLRISQFTIVGVQSNLSQLYHRCIHLFGHSWLAVHVSRSYCTSVRMIEIYIYTLWNAELVASKTFLQNKLRFVMSPMRLSFSIIQLVWRLLVQFTLTMNWALITLTHSLARIRQRSQTYNVCRYLRENGSIHLHTEWMNLTRKLFNIHSFKLNQATSAGDSLTFPCINNIVCNV